MKKHLFTLALLSIAAPLFTTNKPSYSAKPTQPNVLMIIIDDMNDWIDLLDENGPIRTPQLGRLASRGTLFTNAYCSSPACNPSRVSLLTGLRPGTSGVYGNKTNWRAALPSAVTIPQQFMQHGYHVAGAGKIFHHHLAGAFHDASAFHQFRAMPDPPDAPMPQQKLNQLAWYGSPNTDWGVYPADEQNHVDVRTVDYCIERLNEDHGKPLFLAAGIFRPHMPFFAPASAFTKYPEDQVTLPLLKEDDLNDIPTGGKKLLSAKKWFWDGMMKAEGRKPGSWEASVRAYQACATFADTQVGRLLDGLDQSGKAGNTIIVLCSDHGYHLGEKKHWEKFALWEKTTHIPMIVVAPNVTTPGSVCEHPVDLTAIYPTLNELCGFTTPYKLDGVSLVPLLKNVDATWKHPAVMTYGRGNHAVRKGPWRYISYADGTEELYNHQTDKAEHNNLAPQKENAAVIARLRKFLPKVEAKAASDLKKPKSISTK
ncbi:MAG: iduronate-2-sulfatase [Blastopirellula sp.]|nr:MAG: iduronate-2-sulfatase [Blastopirellula sp.]